MIKWNTNASDFRLIVAIAQRIEKDIKGYPDKRQTILMDLQACHENGCRLDLTGLLAADPLDFRHDVLGIRQHINRSTGQLEDGFIPRYAIAVSV